MPETAFASAPSPVAGRHLPSGGVDRMRRLSSQTAPADPIGGVLLQSCPVDLRGTDAADGAVGTLEPRMHPDYSVSASALAGEGYVDAERPQKGLGATQAAGDATAKNPGQKE